MNSLHVDDLGRLTDSETGDALRGVTLIHFEGFLLIAFVAFRADLPRRYERAPLELYDEPGTEEA